MIMDNDALYERAKDDISELIEYRAVVTYDSGMLGQVSAFSIAGLIEQLRKLERQADAFVEREANDRVDNGYYEDQEPDDDYIRGQHVL